MATLSPENIRELADANERTARLGQLRPFFKTYFPGATRFKPWLKRASVEDGPYARLEDVTVFDEAGDIIVSRHPSYRHALQDLSSTVAFYDESEIDLQDVAHKPINIVIDNETFQQLFPDEATWHATPFGLFHHNELDIANAIVSRFGTEAKEDILEHLENSDHLLDVNMATAYAVLQTKGLERSFAELQSQGTKLHTLFFGLDSLEQLIIHLCKLAIIHAVRASC